MKNILLPFLLFIFALSAFKTLGQAPAFLWAKDAGGINHEYCYNIAVDDSGNSYATGFFDSDSITFGSFTLHNAGTQDVYIVKYNTSGNVVWAKSAGGAGGDYGYAVAVDNNGYCYLAGRFQSPTITFGSYTLTDTSAGVDIFIVKYSSSGNVIWAKRAGGTDWDICVGIAADVNGNVYLTGSFRQTARFDAIAVTSAGQDDFFVAKYNSSGNAVWVKRAGNTVNDGGWSIKVDNNGYTYIIGVFYGSTLTFGSTILTNSGSSDFFVVKYDPSGNVVWAKSAGGTAGDEALGIGIDAAGNSYITGFFYSSSITFGSTVITNGGSGNFFITKYNSSGNVVWAKGAVATNQQGNAIATDASGNSYVTGTYYDSITFDTTTLTSAGGGDVFIAKYTSSGNVVWVKSAGGASYDTPNGIGIDAKGNSYIDGYFYSPVMYYESNSIVNASSATTADIFVAKIAACGVWSNVISNVSCYNDCSGSAMVNPNGGILPYTYDWNPSAETSQTASALCASTYTCTVSDAAGCTTSTSVTLTQPTMLVSAITASTYVSCFGGSDGAATVVANGGTGAYNYQWNPAGGSNSVANNLPAGVYTVTVTDMNGCITTSSVTITEPALLSVSIFGSIDASCSSCSDGSAAVNVGGGTGPYTYSWTPGGSNAATATNLSPATYTCCVYDAHGCMTCTSVIISYPSAVNELFTSSDFIIYPNPAHNILNVECRMQNGSTGSPAAELKIYDLTGRVVLQESLHSQLSTFNFQLTAGIYLVRVEAGERVWQEKVVVE